MTTLLYVGRLAVNKRVPVLVEALAQLQDIRPEVHAVIVGDTGDVYAGEATACRELAERLGVGERLHFMGLVSEEELAAAYRTADVLVMPSVHEGFCLPVAEAMAAGLPVVAARAGALPETVGPAGITFAADEAGDLARQLRRVIGGTSPPTRPTTDNAILRIAIVSFRFGRDIVGGAETSLRTIAQTLRQAGHAVEVYTTCTHGECVWGNDVPAGTVEEDGLTIHRFAIDRHDRAAHLDSVRAILEKDGQVAAEIEANYLRHSIHSGALLDALRHKMPELDTVIAGPYLFGLTHDVAASFPEKTLLLPCFHDEPLARLQAWPRAYGSVGGILYHSPEEQELAQTGLGVNHPHAVQIGTWLDMVDPIQKNRSGQRFLVYCGRLSIQKNVPLLLEFIGRYQQERPGRFAWHVMGRGEVALPRADWLHDAGFVDEFRKRALLAGADALVQLSVNESLSLVALEAWSQGTPVVVHEDCAVLAGQIARSQGGQAIADYDGFARALDDLWDNPQAWQERGRRGQDWTRQTYGSRPALLARLTEAVHGLRRPLREHMREKGLFWSARCQREPWRRQFGEFIEYVLDSEPRTIELRMAIHVHRNSLAVAVGSSSLLVAVRLANRGNQVICADGPAQTVLCSEIVADDKVQLDPVRGETPLPGMIQPGETRPAAITLELPSIPGRYRVRLWAERGPNHAMVAGSDTVMSLALQSTAAGSACTPLLEDAAKALAEAHRCQKLPDQYVDVTQGWLAGWKHWLKRKLLGNFKHAYVDVLSRQQSHVNQNLITALQNLAEHCATLEHALRQLQHQIKFPFGGESETPRCPDASGSPLNGDRASPIASTVEKGKRNRT